MDLGVREVFGCENLRVVDASIFPSMTSGNLNAPSMLVAERLADAIQGKELLPALDVEWFEPNKTKQREGA